MRAVFDKCNGCSACHLVCPVEAINISINDKGFYQAFVDEKRCIKCGRCEKICKESKKTLYNIEESEHYVAAAKDQEVLKNSSSGGVAFILASHMIQEGGKVCAVGYNNVANNAQHYIYDDLKSLKESQGSKYLQSYNADAFLSAIQQNEQMIIIGTPCQIAGIREILKEKVAEESFVLVDIFCHGVPSTKLWRNHLSTLHLSGNHQEKPVFRDNKKYILKIQNYKKWYNQDGFFMLYLMNQYLNSCCYSCPYRRKSSADIRLGDLMSEKYSKLWYSPSCVCINSEKGRMFFDRIKKEVECYQISYEEIDEIQQKEGNTSPELINPKYYMLNDPDVNPKQLLGKRFYINYFKSFIKIPILLAKEVFMTDDLGKVVLKEKQ